MGIKIEGLYLRRSALVRATPEVVWEAFTTYERMAAWFGLGHQLDVYEPRLGGAVRLSIESGGRRHVFGGAVTVFDPGEALSFGSDWIDSDQFAPTHATTSFQLTPMLGGTHVELFVHGYEASGEAADQLEAYERGWDNHHLVALRKLIEG